MTEVAETESVRVKPKAKPTVFEAWNLVMRDVQSISKDSRNNTGSGFNFRGIDAVMNAVGPSLREHGVTVVPIGSKYESERYSTAKGAQMVNRTVEMGFTVYGPAGDSFTGLAFGEAADSGDKAMTKAESVALRTFLLQSLMIPTDDPDPDAESHERATPATTARAQGNPPPVTDDNPDSRQARDDLKAIAVDKGWDLGKIADKFSKDNNGKALRHASGADVEAYMNLLITGAVTV